MRRLIKDAKRRVILILDNLRVHHAKNGEKVASREKRAERSVYQYLTWALALFRGGRGREAINKLYQNMLQNLYLVLFLLGKSLQ